MLEKIIKNYDDAANPVVRIRCGRFAGVIGIAVNLLLFAVKLAFGFIAGSISVIADSLNNLSDAGSSVLTFVGYTITGRPADREHPFGHARMEYLSALFISVIVTVLGVQMLTQSAGRLFKGEGAEEYDALTVAIIAVTILVKLFLALFYRRIGRHIGSTALKAAAVDSISDVFTTAAVVAGMLLTPVTGPKTDAVLASLIAIYIIIVGLRLIVDASNTLLGVAPDTALVRKIVEKIRSYDGVYGLHDLVVHSYGAERVFATVHVEVDAQRDITESHDIIDNIEADFARDMNIKLVVHLDPVHTSDPRVNKLKLLAADAVADVAGEYGEPLSMHDFRVVFGVTHTNLIFDVSVSAGFILGDEELCELLSARVRKTDPSYNVVITVDRDYFSQRYGSEKTD